MVYIILFFLLLLAIYDSNNNIDISEYKIKSNKIPMEFNNFKILQLSDLHNKKFGKDNKILVDKINNISPDIIVITGDMLTRNNNEYSTFLNLVTELTKKYKIYFILGNHEQKIKLCDKKIYELFKQIEDLGVILLDNKMIKITKNDSYINIYGLYISLKYYQYRQKHTFELKDIENSIGKLNSEDFNILLTHNPFFFKTYALWGADLTLCGHVHGGIIKVPFIGGVLSPERKFFPKYYEGTYLIDKHTLIVSRGLGVGKTMFRLFNRPELPLIILSN